ncbi:MAG: hypothetical protein ACD_81C00185G0012 [uncultured bacterium]|nr:MAG: hypothetical protein ACD_81C00185G0012 [uncultured bacterium]
MKKEFGLLFWIHILLLIPAYLSPLFIDWKLIVIGIVILQIQYWVIDGCILTHLEMGKDKNETFIWYYLSKRYPNINPKRTKFVIRVIVPVALVMAGFFLQTKFGLEPLIKIF